jgi:hypothetical protein
MDLEVNNKNIKSFLFGDRGDANKPRLRFIDLAMPILLGYGEGIWK